MDWSLGACLWLIPLWLGMLFCCFEPIVSGFYVGSLFLLWLFMLFLVWLTSCWTGLNCPCSVSLPSEPWFGLQSVDVARSCDIHFFAKYHMV